MQGGSLWPRVGRREGACGSWKPTPLLIVWVPALRTSWLTRDSFLEVEPFTPGHQQAAPLTGPWIAGAASQAHSWPVPSSPCPCGRGPWAACHGEGPLCIKKFSLTLTNSDGLYIEQWQPYSDDISREVTCQLEKAQTSAPNQSLGGGFGRDGLPPKLPALHIVLVLPRLTLFLPLGTSCSRLPPHFVSQPQWLTFPFLLFLSTVSLHKLVALPTSTVGPIMLFGHN